MTMSFFAALSVDMVSSCVCVMVTLPSLRFRMVLAVNRMIGLSAKALVGNQNFCFIWVGVLHTILRCPNDGLP